MLHCVRFFFFFVLGLLYISLQNGSLFHSLHFLPYARHFSLLFPCVFPQNLHSTLLLSCLWCAAPCSVCTSSTVGPEMALMFSQDSSVALHNCTRVQCHVLLTEQSLSHACTVTLTHDPIPHDPTSLVKLQNCMLWQAVSI